MANSRGSVPCLTITRFWLSCLGHLVVLLPKTSFFCFQTLGIYISNNLINIQGPFLVSNSLFGIFKFVLVRTTLYMLIITPCNRRGYTVLPVSVRSRYFPSHFFQQLLMAEFWYLVTSFIWVCHIVGSVFGPVRFLHPVCRLNWLFYTLNISEH